MQAIYIDDFEGGVNITSNIFYRVLTGFFSNCGGDFTYQNNLFVVPAPCTLICQTDLTQRWFVQCIVSPKHRPLDVLDYLHACLLICAGRWDHNPTERSLDVWWRHSDFVGSTSLGPLFRRHVARTLPGAQPALQRLGQWDGTARGDNSATEQPLHAQRGGQYYRSEADPRRGNRRSIFQLDSERRWNFLPAGTFFHPACREYDAIL